MRTASLVIFIICFIGNFSTLAQTPERVFRSDGGWLIHKGTDGVMLFSARSKLVSLDELANILGGNKPQVLDEFEDQWTKVAFTLPDQTLKINLSRFSYDSVTDFSPYLETLASNCFHGLADGAMDDHVFNLLRQIHKSNHFYVFQSSEKLPEEIESVARQLAGLSSSIIMIEGEIFDPKMQRLLGEESQRNAKARFPIFESAIERKKRSMAELRRRKFDVLDMLPTIVADEEVRFQEPEIVAKRMFCLLAVSGKASELEGFDWNALLTKHELWDYLSPAEAKFLQNDAPDQVQVAEMTWRFESAYALYWALGLEKDLSFPANQIDPEKFVKSVFDNIDELTSNAKFRPTAELLDQIDLHYRCNWTTRNQMLDGKELKGLSPDVVYERCFAFNWLIRYLGMEWDQTVVDS
ncbi:MAG: DUF4272 domain-containing protein [Pirellulaceae bacterium]